MKNSGPSSHYLPIGVGVGVVADPFAVADAGDAARATKVLSAAQAGELQHFSLRYLFHAPSRQRWVLMFGALLAQPHGGAVVRHEEVAEWALPKRHTRKEQKEAI